MGYAQTLIQFKARLKERWPRGSVKWDNMVENDVAEWISTLNSVFPFWFVTMFPGRSLPLTFPISTLSSVPALGGRWVDVGWLVTQPGVAAYDFYHPVEEEESANADWWVACKVQMVDFVYEFTTEGRFNGSLPVPEYEGGLLYSSFKQQGRPHQMMWRTTETKSELHFHPTPDKAYLYAIQFAIQDPPFYEDGGQTYNKWLTHAPEAVMLYGHMKAAALFDEPKMEEKYRAELFGSGGSGGSRVGGLLGDLKKDTIKRTRSSQEQLSAFGSMTEATGRPMGLSNSRQRYFNNRYRGIGWR